MEHDIITVQEDLFLLCLLVAAAAITTSAYLIMILITNHRLLAKDILAATLMFMKTCKKNHMKAI